MTIQELIDKLESCPDKSATVLIMQCEYGEGDYVFDDIVSFEYQEDDHTGNNVIITALNKITL